MSGRRSTTKPGSSRRYLNTILGKHIEQVAHLALRNLVGANQALLVPDSSSLAPRMANRGPSNAGFLRSDDSHDVFLLDGGDSGGTNSVFTQWFAPGRTGLSETLSAAFAGLGGLAALTSGLLGALRLRKSRNLPTT